MRGRGRRGIFVFPEKNLWHFLPLQEPGKGRTDREADREKAETGEREKKPNARYYFEHSDRPCCRPAPRRERPIWSFRKLQHFYLSGSQSEAESISVSKILENPEGVEISTVSAGAQFVPPFQKKSVLLVAPETGGRPRQKRFSRAHEGGGDFAKEPCSRLGNTRI